MEHAEHPKGARLGAAFCSARFRDVPVLVQADAELPPVAGQRMSARPDPDALLACLDYGVRCTGWLCPLFAVPALPPEDLLAEAMEAERRRIEGAQHPPDAAAEG